MRKSFYIIIALAVVAAVALKRWLLPAIAKPRTSVKPLGVGPFANTWVIVRGNAITQFRDDLRRYGAETAIHNLLILLDVRQPLAEIEVVQANDGGDEDYDDADW